GAGSVEFAAFLSFGAGKLSQEIFVDTPKGVVLHRNGNSGDFLQQFLEKNAVEDLVSPRERSGELRVVLLDVCYRFIQFLTDIGAFRQIQQAVETGIRREV